MEPRVGIESTSEARERVVQITWLVLG